MIVNVIKVNYHEDELIKECKVKHMVEDDLIKPMLTVREVARLLNVHSNTVRRWSDRGILKAYRITHRGDRRFRREDIISFLAELKASEGDERQASINQNGILINQRFTI